MKVMKKINIVYDTALFDGNNKTGIYRVGIAILDELVKRDSVNIILYSSSKNRHTLELMSQMYEKLDYIQPVNKLSFKIKDILGNLKNRSKLKNANFYLTPVFVVPKHLRKYKNLTFCSIVYDMLPILFPQWFQESDRKWHKTLIDSIQNSDLIFSISECTSKDFLEYKKTFPKKNVTLMPLALPIIESKEKVSITECFQKFNIHANAKYFLTLSTVEYRKNIIHIIESFLNFLQSQEQEIYLVVAGYTHPLFKNTFDAFYNNIDDKLKKYIIITGFIDDGTKEALYTHARLFISMPIYDGFSLPNLEALYYNLPVITSNTSAIPESVGDAAILLDPHDKESLSLAMAKLNENEEMRQDLLAKGKVELQKRSWEKTVDIILNNLSNH